MQHTLLARRLTTPGHRALSAAYGVVSTAGALLALAVVDRLTGGQASLSYHIWVSMSGAAAAALAYNMSSPRMGHGGLAGSFRAASGILLVSFIASLMAGSLILPFYGTMFGPFTMIVTFAAAPAWAGLWFGALAAAHSLTAVWRAETAAIAVESRDRD